MNNYSPEPLACNTSVMQTHRLSPAYFVHPHIFTYHIPQKLTDRFPQEKRSRIAVPPSYEGFSGTVDRAGMRPCPGVVELQHVRFRTSNSFESIGFVQSGTVGELSSCFVSEHSGDFSANSARRRKKQRKERQEKRRNRFRNSAGAMTAAFEGTGSGNDLNPNRTRPSNQIVQYHCSCHEALRDHIWCDSTERRVI